MEENITAALASFAVEDGTPTKPQRRELLMIRLPCGVPVSVGSFRSWHACSRSGADDLLSI